jgi:hypothetical protein
MAIDAGIDHGSGRNSNPSFIYHLLNHGKSIRLSIIPYDFQPVISRLKTVNAEESSL